MTPDPRAHLPAENARHAMLAKEMADGDVAGLLAVGDNGPALWSDPW